MKLLILIFIFSLLHQPILFAQPPENSCEHSKTTFRCVKYIRNYDGDTVTVKIPNVHPVLGENISVRVAGIDTAELRGQQPCEKDLARTAKKLVAAQLKQARNIEIRNVKRDKYFRILGDIYVDGVSLKDVLTKNNLAVAYDGGKKSQVNWCEMGPRLPAQSQ
jgi:micrococcal nuclease